MVLDGIGSRLLLRTIIDQLFSGSVHFFNLSHNLVSSSPTENFLCGSSTEDCHQGTQQPQIIGLAWLEAGPFSVRLPTGHWDG